MTDLRTPAEAGITKFPTTATNIAACNLCGGDKLRFRHDDGDNVVWHFCSAEHYEAIVGVLPSHRDRI